VLPCTSDATRSAIARWPKSEGLRPAIRCGYHRRRSSRWWEAMLGCPARCPGALWYPPPNWVWNLTAEALRTVDLYIPPNRERHTVGEGAPRARTGGARSVSVAHGDRGASVRGGEGVSRLPPLRVAGLGQRVGGVAADQPDAQRAEALPRRLAAGGRATRVGNMTCWVPFGAGEARVAPWVAEGWLCSVAAALRGPRRSALVFSPTGS
jgi:hypothetical protein